MTSSNPNEAFRADERRRILRVHKIVNEEIKAAGVGHVINPLIAAAVSMAIINRLYGESA